MSKEEFFKKYQKIILKTNGGNDDYVVAICQISNLINEFANEQEKQIIYLQSQLAEKEEQLNSAQVGEQFALKCCIEARELLAEKEKEIKDKQTQIANLFSTQQELVDALYYFETKYKGKWKHKDIKDFVNREQNQKAIEQLAEVKEWCVKYLSYCAYRDNAYENIFELLDCKINELKGEQK